MFGAKYSRSKFWIISIILFIVDVFLGIFIRVFEHSNEYQSQAMSLSIITLVIAIVWMNTLANRIRDYGSNPYIALWAIIPLVNIILAFYYGSVKSKKKEDMTQDSKSNTNSSLVKAVKNHAQDIAEDAKENLEEYKDEHQTRKNQTIETTPAPVQSTTIKENIDEDALYEHSMSEIENDTQIKSLWAKAFANSEGNEEKTKALYIQYRVENLKKIHEETRQNRMREEKERSNKEANETIDVFLKENNLKVIRSLSDTKYEVSSYNSPMNAIVEYRNGIWSVVKWS